MLTVNSYYGDAGHSIIKFFGNIQEVFSATTIKWLKNNNCKNCKQGRFLMESTSLRSCCRLTAATIRPAMA